VEGQSCNIENIREDFIKECTLIEASEVEALLREDKIVEMVVWSLIKEEERESTEEEKDVQIKALLEEFADVFFSKLHLPPDRGTHNFCIRTVAGAKPQVHCHGRLSKQEMEEMKKKIKKLLAAGHIKPSASLWSAPILFVYKKDSTLRLCTITERSTQSQYGTNIYHPTFMQSLTSLHRPSTSPP
jgi:hypothetical protein